MHCLPQPAVCSTDTNPPHFAIMLLLLQLSTCRILVLFLDAFVGPITLHHANVSALTTDACRSVRRSHRTPCIKTSSPFLPETNKRRAPAPESLGSQHATTDSNPDLSVCSIVTILSGLPRFIPQNTPSLAPLFEINRLTQPRASQHVIEVIYEYIGEQKAVFATTTRWY